MKFDTSGIDQRAFAQQLRAAYGFDIATITFLPAGEEAFCYFTAGQEGSRYFVRAQRVINTAHLETVYTVTNLLHTQCGLPQVLAPFATLQGTFTCEHTGYSVAVFPFIEGRSAYDAGRFSDVERDQAADLLAALHASDKTCVLPALPRETFANPFQAPIRRALQAAATMPLSARPFQRHASRLLLAEQTDLLVTLDHMHHLQRMLQQQAPSLVPTHGDPNLANFLIDLEGALHLTDWGEVTLGPRERDLWFFNGDLFAPFLRRYAAGPVRLHASLFDFYEYRWTLQEIADYTGRLLFENAEPEQDRYAWEELRPYLPIPHEASRARLHESRTVLQRLASDGVVDVVNL